MRRTTDVKSSAGRLKNALQVVWRGQAPPGEHMSQGSAHQGNPSQDQRHVVLHVHRHQRQSAGKHVATPPLLRRHSLQLLHLPLHKPRTSFFAADLIQFVPTFPTSLVTIHLLLTPQIRGELTVADLRKFLLRNFVYFSRTLDDHFYCNPIAAKAAGFGAADCRVAQAALDDWTSLEKIVKILPLEFTHVDAVKAAYEDVHREPIPTRSWESLADVCDFKDHKTFIRMKVDLYLPGKGAHSAQPRILQRNEMLQVVCETVPTRFVRFDVVCSCAPRDMLASRGFANMSLKRILLDPSVAHAIEFTGPFVKIAKDFVHRDCGCADSKYSESNYAEYNRKPEPATGVKRKPAESFKSWTEKIRNLLPVEKLGESLPPATIHVCSTVQEGAAAAERIQLLLKSCESKEGGPTIGLDMEWAHEKRVALVQLAVVNEVFLLRLHSSSAPTNLLEHFPAELRKILRDSTVLKTGVGIHSDATRLRVLHDITILGCVDIREMMLFSGFPSAACSLHELVHTICKIQFIKAKEVALSNWEALSLTHSQQVYAANDAVGSLAAGLAVQRLVPHGTFSGLVDHRDGLSVKQLVRINTLRRIRNLTARIVDEDVKLKAEKRLKDAKCFGDLQKLHYLLAARVGPESAPFARDELPSIDDIISHTVDKQLVSDAQLVSAPTMASHPARDLKPEVPRRAAEQTTPATAATPLPPQREARPPPPPPPTTPQQFPKPIIAPPVHAQPAQVTGPVASERNKLVEQYMKLQQQRTSALSTGSLSIQQRVAEVTAASSASGMEGPGATPPEEDLEALQREFESQFSEVLSSASTGGGAKPAPVSPPQTPQRAAPVTAARSLPVEPPMTPQMKSAGGYLQPEVTQIPLPPAIPAPRKPVDGLPPSTKKFSPAQSSQKRDEGKHSDQNELIQRLTSELLSATIPVPPTTRRMPAQNASSQPSQFDSDTGGSMSINVDQLRRVLEALKR